MAAAFIYEISIANEIEVSHFGLFGTVALLDTCMSCSNRIPATPSIHSPAPASWLGRIRK